MALRLAEKRLQCGEEGFLHCDPAKCAGSPVETTVFCSARIVRKALRSAYFYLNGFSFALAALGKPRGESFGESVRRQAKARLHMAISGRQGVIEFSRIREITHAELIEPFQRTSLAFAANQDIDIKFLRVHGKRIPLAQPDQLLASATICSNS
jgi:hypothetical protein